jgi:hypothetical protein
MMMRKNTMILAAGMVFLGVVVGLILHATGTFFAHVSMVKNVGSTVLVSVFYTLGMLSVFRPKIELGQEWKAFFPVPQRRQKKDRLTPQACIVS